MSEKKPDDRFEEPVIEISAEGQISIRSLPGAVIRYMVNGYTPTEASPIYEKPFSVTVQDRGVKAKAWLGERHSKIATLVTRMAKTLNLEVFVVEKDAPVKSSKKKSKKEESKKADKDGKEKRDKPLTNKVFAEIRKFRFIAASTADRMVTAERALTTWNEVKNRVDIPPQKDVTALLGDMYQKQIGNPIEAHVIKLAPTWLYPLIQECTRMINSNLSAKDPEKPDFNRRVLIHNNERRKPEFNSVGLPVLCGASTSGYVRWNGWHRISLKWDKEVGWIEFGLCGKRTDSGCGLDPYQINIIKKIQSGEYQQGTTKILLEKDGRLRLSIPYSYTPRPRSIHQDRIMEIVFTDDQEKFIKAKLDGGSSHRDVVDLAWNQSLSCAAAIDQLRRLENQKKYVETVRKACGSHTERKRGSGHPAGYHAAIARGERLSKGRSNTAKTWNHIWAYAVTNWAISRDCGQIKVYGVPDNLFGWQWQFFDFKSKLQYKAQERGLTITFETETDVVISTKNGAVSIQQEAV